MIQDVKDDTSGEFKSALVALMEAKRDTPPDAQVKSAIR